MRTTSGVKVLVGALVVLGAFLVKQSFAAEAKFAYVDLATAFDSYQKTKDYDTKLQDMQQGKQKEIDVKVKEIKDAQDKLPLLAEKEKAKKQAEIDAKTKDLQDFQRKAETELREQRDNSLKEILKDIQDVVNDMSKKEKYMFVFNERVLLYGDPALDITKTVVDKLNSQVSKKK